MISDMDSKMAAPRMSIRDWLEKDQHEKLHWLLSISHVKQIIRGASPNPMTLPQALMVDAKEVYIPNSDFSQVLALTEHALSLDYDFFEKLKKRWPTVKHRKNNNIHKGSRVYLSKEADRLIPEIKKALRIDVNIKNKTTIVNDLILSIGENLKVENKYVKTVEQSNSYLRKTIQELQEILESNNSNRIAFYEKTRKELLKTHQELAVVKARLEAALNFIENPDMRKVIETQELDANLHERIKRFVSLLYSNTPDLAELVRPD